MSQKTLSVYDPALCCSTGVCGPTVDPKLARFAADLDWLSGQGVQVERFNLAQQPGAFVQPLVKGALEAIGEGALPMLLIDGHQVMSGAHPTREQLAGWFGVSLETEPKDEAKDEAKDEGGCCGPKTAPKTGCC